MNNTYNPDKNMTAYVSEKLINPNGSYTYAEYKLPCKVKETRKQKMGVPHTKSGYGKRIPSAYMVNLNGRWRRVYIRQYSNSGTLYIEKPNGEWITVQTITDTFDADTANPITYVRY